MKLTESKLKHLIQEELEKYDALKFKKAVEDRIAKEQIEAEPDGILPELFVLYRSWKAFGLDKTFRALGVLSAIPDVPRLLEDLDRQVNKFGDVNGFVNWAFKNWEILSLPIPYVGGVSVLKMISDDVLGATGAEANAASLAAAGIAGLAGISIDGEKSVTSEQFYWLTYPWDKLSANGINYANKKSFVKTMRKLKKMGFPLPLAHGDVEELSSILKYIYSTVVGSQYREDKKTTILSSAFESQIKRLNNSKFFNDPEKEYEIKMNPAWAEELSRSFYDLQFLDFFGFTFGESPQKAKERYNQTKKEFMDDIQIKRINPKYNPFVKDSEDYIIQSFESYKSQNPKEFKRNTPTRDINRGFRNLQKLAYIIFNRELPKGLAKAKAELVQK